MEEVNVGSKGKYLKQGLTSTKGLPLMLPWGRDSPYHRSD